MRTLPVDLVELEDAFRFQRTEPNEGEAVAYLDLSTGSVVYLYEDDDEYEAITNDTAVVNAELRQSIEAAPERFVLIPEPEVDDNEILREFLDSEWTSDRSRRERAREAYRGSVGRWRRAIQHDEETLHAWRSFEDSAFRRMMLAFLSEHGIRLAGEQA